jgi:site-specific DNA-methyltransferase (adenine-specific)
MEPYYKNELTTIYNGDCLEVMDYLIEQGIKVDLVCIDPDYEVTKRGNGGNAGGMMQKKEVHKGSMFVTNQLDIKDWLPKLIELMKDDTQFYIFTNDKNLNYYLTTLKEFGLKIYKNLVWVKDNKIMGKYYMTQKEYIIFGRKKDEKVINDCGTSDILMFPNIKDKNHLGDNHNDTEKPLELGELLIKNSTKENELVLDIMCGTGTFNVGSQRTNRKSIGIDIRESQCKRTKWRLQNIQTRLDI